MRRMLIAVPLMFCLSGCGDEPDPKTEAEKLPTTAETSVSTKQEDVPQSVEPSEAKVNFEIPNAPVHIQSLEEYDVNLEFIVGRILDNAYLDPALGFMEKEDYDVWQSHFEVIDVKLEGFEPIYYAYRALEQVNTSREDSPFDNKAYTNAFITLHNTLVETEDYLWTMRNGGALSEEFYRAYDQQLSGYWMYLHSAYLVYSGTVSFSNKNEEREYWGTIWDYQDYYFGNRGESE